MKKQLIAIFILILVSKIILSSFITVPLGFSDSLSYVESAKTFYDNPNLLDLAESKYPFLYPVLISPAFMFQDMTIVNFAIQIINAILSTLILFPAFLLSKEFLNKKKSLLVATIVTLLPAMFNFTYTPMSENIFYPLFLTAIYLTYKAFTSNKLSFQILAGTTLGLCFLTKILAIFLVPVILILIIYKKQLKLPLLISGTLTSLFWIIPRIILYGFNVSYMLGYPDSVEATNNSYLFTKIIWTFIYTNYILVGTGILFGILTILLIKSYKNLKQNEKTFTILSLSSILFLTIISANHSGGFPNYDDYRIIGRYIATIFPLVIILGTIALKTNKTLNKPLIILTTIFTTLFSYLLMYDLFFPINNMSWSHIGVLNYFLPSIVPVLLITLATLSFLLIKKLNTKTILSLFIIFFLSVSLLNTAIIYYDSEHRWEPTDTIQLGYWLNDNIKQGTVMYDLEEYETQIQITGDLTETRERPTLASAYYLRAQHARDTIENLENYDYIITEKELPLTTLYELNKVKVYHNP